MSEQTVPRPRAAAPVGRRAGGGADRVTVALFSLAAFLLVLALLASQLTHASATPTSGRAVLLRRVYRTTVVERVLPAGSGGAGGTSVTQSVSASGASALPAAAPTTRTS